MYTDERLLEVIEARRAQLVPGAPNNQAFMPWQILAQLERVDVTGPLESAQLNDLQRRAPQLVTPGLRRLAAAGKITFDGGGVWL